ncbi:MAG: PQQ-binding-like beta-propeller repeat protein [Gemmataceae bacterium]|nr:PQQ-binding-like beta-propeller repeat protein [Gemmataceae bacterium]
MKKLIALALFGVGTSLLAADNWPQFRGPQANGATQADLPDTFGPKENVRWAVDLPGRGLSCPAIHGDKLFLTASSGMDDTRLHVLAFDVKTGVKLWERQLQCSGPTQCHPLTCMACPTPVTDGKHVWFAFATGDVAAFTVDGDLVWMRALAAEYPKLANFVGRSSSPVLASGTLGMLIENQGESYLFGIDPLTGATRWKADRPTENNWSTPLAWERGGQWEFVVQAAKGMTAYNAADGKAAWTFDSEKLNQICSPVTHDGKILATGRGLFALRPGEKGVEAIWKSKELGSDNPTPVIVGDKIYAQGRNILKCGDLTSGKQLWDLRINGRQFWASPVYAQGKLFLTESSGKVIVVKVTGDEPKVIATNDFGETLLATPAIAGDAIFFRSDKHLWCFAGGKKSS